ncbi:MAG: hypothetical protein ACXW52_23975, partial [Candidatus Binatia bacterium]
WHFRCDRLLDASTSHRVGVRWHRGIDIALGDQLFIRVDLDPDDIAYFSGPAALSTHKSNANRFSRQ